MTPPDPIPPLGPWQDSENIGQRSNGLMRENWLILDEAAALFNAGDFNDDVCDEIHDLLGLSFEIEGRYATVRQAEFAEVQRQWCTRAFVPNYERELGWA